MPWVERGGSWGFGLMRLAAAPWFEENENYTNKSCRRGETTDAIGRLKLGPMDAGDTGEGLRGGSRTQTRTHTHDLPRFGALVRR